MTAQARTRNVLWLLVLLALVVAWSARAAEPDGKADPITFGTTQSLTGHYRDFGTEQLRGLQMWVHDINARGALLGRPVKLVHYDDHSRSASAAEGAKRLIEQDGVDFLVGPYSSALTLRASLVAEEHGIPMVATAASSEEIWSRGLHNIFGIDVPADSYLYGVEVVTNAGARTAALLYAQTEFGIETAAGARKSIGASGARLLLDEGYAPEQRNFDTLAGRIAQLKPDVVLGISYLEDSVAIVDALERAGAHPPMLAFTVGPALHEFGEALGDKAEGVVGIVQWLRSVPVPGAEDFAYRYRQAYGYDPGVYAVIGYSAGQVLEAAIRLAGTTDHDTVREQLRSMSFRSLLGRYSVDANGRQVSKRNYVLQWQDGERRLIAPEQLAERKLIYPRP